MTQGIVRNTAIALSTFACATLFSVTWSEQGGISASVESAQARVGRPLTPVSVAGVARRQTRRAAYGYGVGAGVAATAAVAAAAATAPAYSGWGTNDWTNSYAAQTDPYFGQPYYPARAYQRISPYYGYAGWTEYKAANGIGCEPGTMTKMADGRMYVCQ
ncbi:MULTISPECIES: hypothetical protein [Bradyrhizobium]|uniref:hypothetical protein n=1 Tax=Bradyrhizobium TaxID=374 RepID=UPI001FDA3EC8|nr:MULTISPECIES: hypothetical protein [Bradyrhizobium]MCP3413258.1 hypothetical protein [Bradyrhizobium brasilense]MCS3452829.1 hypothetical protein [Bradyrhizobium elkanii]MCS3565067.1 hypothetical protein [Bradyrhizobium elkanii]MCW2145105.1 hypothetical protein [Bradyrhizobium elkanii]MCW2356078.1 hypothetical protein [Bradyrhizobium elkanii]